MVLALICVAVTTAVRVPITNIHPFAAGPRYFFYPFIMLGWMLIWLIAVSDRRYGALLGAVLCGSVLQAVPNMTRRHDALDWSQHVQACAKSDRYVIPIHEAGSKSAVWHVELTGAQCRRLLARSWF